MIRAMHALEDGEDEAVLLLGLAMLALAIQRDSEVVAREHGVGMLGAEDTLTKRKNSAVFSLGLITTRLIVESDGAVVAEGEDVRMLGTVLALVSGDEAAPDGTGLARTALGLKRVGDVALHTGPFLKITFFIRQISSSTIACESDGELAALTRGIAGEEERLDGLLHRPGGGGERLIAHLKSGGLGFVEFFVSEQRPGTIERWIGGLLAHATG
jgi:hypothetical protein